MKIGVMILYFFLVIAIGGIGCWISLAQHLKHPTADSFPTYLGNLGTFSISVSVLAFADALINTAMAGRRIWLLFLFVVMMAALCFSAASIIVRETFMGWIALIAVVLTTIEWFVVHFYDPAFEVAGDARTTLGGALPGL